MKRFTFPLESLRLLRKQKEEHALQVCAEATRRAQAVVHRLEALRAEQEQHRQAARRQIDTGAEARDLAQTAAFLRTVVEQETRLAAELRTAEAQVQQARQALSRATRDHDALQYYREKLHHAYCAQEARQEQKALDEAGSRLMRRAGSGLLRSTPDLTNL
jgi:flagellar export protein FliJ